MRNTFSTEISTKETRVILELYSCSFRTNLAEGLEDTGNTITFTVLFTLVKTWFFATPVQVSPRRSGPDIDNHSSIPGNVHARRPLILNFEPSNLTEDCPLSTGVQSLDLPSMSESPFSYSPKSIT